MNDQKYKNTSVLVIFGLNPLDTRSVDPLTFDVAIASQESFQIAFARAFGQTPDVNPIFDHVVVTTHRECDYICLVYEKNEVVSKGQKWRLGNERRKLRSRKWSNY